ncbi:ROK family protein [Enterococcus hulanensis]|uniref:ROK family protein n=1 Tax=Enterococcus hulanensis TaxID=2559929 RepID=A0ABU3F130_9ENTE|nr:ROK family protein [Enterococcus hulanensis]MDT2600836.1 ROK family protein [Enterococcus hulanensis]MDT2611943.1 ROK family protein [Enterococcus hulanensis]MDT2618091.1 ROK family protein [Enterococcus hulanensis]MDT2629094.1 ROK family protein [Enterococcus hulanensis]MDT2656656.1 ROK family protein [Enterococcus hulanensis]
MNQKILAIDIGGTAIKSGLWENEALIELPSFETPKTWDEMKAYLKILVEKNQITDGVAISAPGAVDAEEGVIYGVSAVPYLHRFPIKQELAEFLGVPVSFQNDANCAALAELWQGNAKGLESAALMIIGTGIGGGIAINGKLRPGSNLFGGEFGYQIMNNDTLETLSDLGSPVAMSERFSKIKADGREYTSKEIFDLAEAGDELAQEQINQLYQALSIGIYNILISLDPDRVLIGGGISMREDLLLNIEERVQKLLLKKGAKELKASIMPCKFLNQANLIGAVSQFLTEQA